MLETKCVGEKLEMLVIELVVFVNNILNINITYVTQVSGTNICKFFHQLPFNQSSILVANITVAVLMTNYV